METRLPDCLSVEPGKAKLHAPLDMFDLAVRLEAEGVTDEAAHADYGFATTMAMARDCFPSIERAAKAQGPARPADEQGGESILRAWLRGTAFALPMLLCAAALMSTGVSLWGGDLPGDTASAVAIATVASLIVTGGFVQAMARRGLFHIGARNFQMAAALCSLWGRTAAVALGVTAAGAQVANLLFDWMPASLAAWSSAFFLLLGFYWLACGALYIVGRGRWIVLSTVAGIATVAALHLGAGVGLLTAQLMAVTIATLTAVAGTGLFFRKQGVRLDQCSAGPISPARELYLTAPYFLYGAAYYVFMFTDRLLAWTAGTNAAALPLQFRGDYETALDLAMVALVPQAGLVQASLVSFHREVRRVQEALPAGHFSRFNEMLREFYLWRVARIAAFGFAASGAVFAAVTHLHLLPFEAMRPVLLLALAAFPVLVMGLWNASLLFALGTPTPVVGAVTLGIAFSLAPGYLLTRTGSYDAAVVGFLIGAFTFAAVSGFSVLKRFRSLDHHYYASAL